MTDVLTLLTDDEVYDELVEVAGKRRAEWVGGQVHVMTPTGEMPGRAAENVLVSLRAFERHAGGRATGDNVSFVVNLPGRRSFSPDASYRRLPSKPTMRYVAGAPDFAVEVRSVHDYGPRAEERLALKRDDYFAAGTQVVWDVDLVGPDTIRVYRADRPDVPDVFRRGETADAEPAVPGWRFPVDELFA